MHEIARWLSGSRDYAEGVVLFTKYSKNKVLARMFQRGAARFHASKLEYELGKLLNGARPSQRTTPISTSKSTAKQGTVRTPNMEVHPVILATKKEVASLYAQIDKMHYELYELGTSNDKATVEARRRILERRQPIIERADALYRFKEEYFRTSGQNQKAVLDKITELQKADVKQQPTTAVNAVSGTIAKMDDMALLKRRNTLRSSIIKTQNMLQYQSIRKGETPTPMPDGFKRDQYAKKLEDLKVEYDAVLSEIKRRSNQ